MAIPKRVSDRIPAALKRLLPIIEQQRTRDVSEADTVTLVKDLMDEVFGYDKYADLTSELSIRGTYCDLAVKLDGKFTKLVEVKAIGVELNDRHVKQAVDYGSNQGIEWVILTNGAVWQLYQVIFAKPIDRRLVAELDLAKFDARKDSDLETIFVFTKEGYTKGAPGELRDRQDATSRFLIAALLLKSEPVMNVLRRELRRVVDVSVDEADILKVLETEVIKRDALEGANAEQAAGRVRRARDKSLVTKKEGEGGSEDSGA